MVPSSAADDAIEALFVLSEPSATQPSSNTLLMDKIRMVVEAVFFGWFIPRRRRKDDSEST
jgi:hypothetical protein